MWTTATAHVHFDTALRFCTNQSLNTSMMALERSWRTRAKLGCRRAYLVLDLIDTPKQPSSFAAFLAQRFHEAEQMISQRSQLGG
jgi:hypothetical protein